VYLLRKLSDRQENKVSFEQDNRAATLHMSELFNRGDIDGYARFFADEVINHGYRMRRDDIRLVIQDIRSTFPDAQFEPIQTLAEGEWVTFRTRFAGTHGGVGRLSVNGGMLVGVPPTLKRFSVEHIHLLRFRDGRITEHYACRDDIEMMRQLGLMPPLSPQ
jgi:predicted ester cyclase